MEEVLKLIKDLGAKEISENTRTIKRQIEDFTSEEEILKNKQASIDETLNNAITAYDEITALATKTNNADSLAKVIESKIKIIERLTQEKINIRAQLDRLARSKALQLDRLEYTYFNVNIIENKYIDGKSIKDSWKAEIKKFVSDVNDIAQNISINLLKFLLNLVLVLAYCFILLFIAKIIWRAVKYIWNK